MCSIIISENITSAVFLSFCLTNYFIRSNIKVEFYKGKAKITSPGGLYKTLYKTTLEDVLKGVQTYRNERLVHLLDKLGLIENYGTGIARTLNAYKGTGREPEFYDSENFFIVYLPNLNYRDQINDQITELGLSILRTVSGNPGIKADRIHEILSSEDKAITLNMVRNSIKRELRNYIELRGSRKTGGYYLKEIPHKPGE